MITVNCQINAQFALSDSIVCVGECIQIIDESTNALGSTIEAREWTINGGSPGTSSIQSLSNVCFDSPGTYEIILTVTNDFGNSDDTKMQITVLNSADASWELTDELCNSSLPIDLSVLITGNVGVTFFGTGITGNHFDPSVGTQSITYTIGIPHSEDSLTQIINVIKSGDTSWLDGGIYISEKLTQNDDSFNDLWIILGLENYPNSNIDIFNRWGSKVSSTNYQNDWDCTSQSKFNISGNQLTESVYFYILTLGDSGNSQNHGKVIKGYIYNKR